MKEMEPLSRDIRLLTDEEGRRLAARNPNLPATPEQCITCHGRGSFMWWNDERTEPVEWKCNCVDQWVLHRVLLSAGVGVAYQRLGWGDATSVEPGAKAKVQDYLEHAEAYLSAGCGLILYGAGLGNGKTLMATLIIKKLVVEGQDGFVTTFADMLQMFTSTFRDQEEKKWFYRRIKNAGVLVLDDVGREHKQRRILTKVERERTGSEIGAVDFTTSMAESTFDEVLRHRVASALPTIITTNLDLDKLQESYGGNVMSLLHERSTTYRFTGGDFRDQARLRLSEEIAMGLQRPLVVG